MNKKKYIVMGIVIVILVLIDQISKLCIASNFESSQVLIKNVFSIEIVEKAESILNRENIQNMLLSIFVIFIMIKFMIRHDKHINKLVIVCLSMIIAGGIGNLIDRIFRGAVFDFIKLGMNFPVFNFADILIFIGWIIYIIYLMIFAFKTV